MHVKLKYPCKLGLKDILFKCSCFAYWLRLIGSKVLLLFHGKLALRELPASSLKFNFQVMHQIEEYIIRKTERGLIFVFVINSQQCAK